MILTKIKTPPEPQAGDYKIEKHFAWWPKKVDGFEIWMEPYKKVYEYKKRTRYGHLYGTGVVLTFPNCGGWDLIATQRVNIKS